MSVPRRTDHVVWLHQQHDRAGRPRYAVRFIPVYVPAHRAASEVLLEVLRPLSPRETGRSGVYWYSDERGSGWVEVSEMRSWTRVELDDAVRTLEISARLGLPEVYRQPVLGFGQATVMRTTNPYFLMAAGFVMVIATGWLVGTGLTRMMEPGRIFGVVLGTIIGPVGCWMFANGARRRRWWHLARAEAKRMGRPMPHDLRVWA